MSAPRFVQRNCQTAPGKWLAGAGVWLCALLAVVTLARAQESPWVLSTSRTEPYFPPYIGNGHFSLSGSPTGTAPAPSYMAWVYDHGKGDIPRIARLPWWNEIDIFNGEHYLNQVAPGALQLEDYSQTLDMYNGQLRTAYRWRDGDRAMDVEVTAFVSRADPHLAVVHLTLQPQFTGEVRLRFPLQGADPPERLPLAELEHLAYDMPGGWPSVWYPGYVQVVDRGVELNARSGRAWVVAQAEGRPTSVALVGEVVWPEELPRFFCRSHLDSTRAEVEVAFRAQAGGRYTFSKIIAAVSSRERPNHLAAALWQARRARTLGYEAIFREHARAWHHLWEADILVEGDPEFQRLIHSMMFYLLGSVAEGGEFSLPPMGLSTAGYYGHIFWDADTWMFPALLLLHPELARSVVMFRYLALDNARLNARLNGYEGAMYPWESDELGKETTPRFAYQNALYEIHVTGDVALAQWQYYLATGDEAYLRQYGYPVIEAIADFWVSRVTYHDSLDRYELRKVVSVDEGLIGIDNDVYTNAVARKSLQIALRAGELLGRPANPRWREVAEKLFLPYDAEQDYHPTYEGAPPEVRGSVVVLLSYPLEVPMRESTKRHNFEHALRRARERGQGGMMTVTFFPILAVELGDQQALDQWMPRSYQPYLRPPFNVLAETGNNNAINFITGAGGFLQQVLYGYTGLRWTEAGLEQKYTPMLPSNISRMILKNITVRGERFDVVVENGQLQWR